MVSRSYDHTLRIWDAGLAAVAPLQTPAGHSDYVSSVAFFRDETSIETRPYFWGRLDKEGEENLIWLHPDYQGRLVGSIMGMVELAQPSRKILLMRFKIEPKAIYKATW